MRITVFKKNRQTHDGRKFVVYVSKLKKKDGTEQYVSVKFDQNDNPDPAKCPVVIDVNKETANLSKRTTVDAVTGEARENFTLWVKEWKESGEKWVDHSLDDYE